MRHLQRGNERLGQQALVQVIADWRLSLALHYARIYAAEMAVAGQWYFGTGGTFSSFTFLISRFLNFMRPDSWAGPER